MSSNLDTPEGPFHSKRRLERSPNQVSPPTKSVKMGLCKICNKSLRTTEGPYVTCIQCNNNYHVSCLSMHDKYIDFLKTINNMYICPACHVQSSTTNAFLLSKIDDIMKKMDEKLEGNPPLNMNSLAELIMKSVSKAVAPLETSINEIKDSLSANTNRINTLEAKVEEILSNANANIGAITITKEILNLKAQLVQNNLIISGIKQSNDENVFTILQNIGAKLNTRIDPSNVKRIVRMQKAGLKEEKQPSSILVEFVHDHVKERLMKNYLTFIRTKQPLKCCDIGINTDGRIYINKHVPKEVIKLFGKCNQMKKEGKIQHAIPKNDFVLIKFKDKWIRIYNEPELTTLAGT